MPKRRRRGQRVDEDDDDDENEVESTVTAMDPLMCVAIAAIPRLGGSSPMACVASDRGLFRTLAEFVVVRRPIIISRRTFDDFVFALGESVVKFGRPRLESCGDTYEVQSGWRNKRWSCGILGYRGLWVWGLVKSYYRGNKEGHRWAQDVTESALLGVVSWNPASGDVFSKTLLLSGQEAYDSLVHGFAATWSWPLVAFLSSPDKVCVASAVTGAVLTRIDVAGHVLRSFRSMVMCDVQTDHTSPTQDEASGTKKCLCFVTTKFLECIAIDNPESLLHKVAFEELLFVHPRTVIVSTRDVERGAHHFALDPATGKQLASGLRRTDWSSKEASRLWTLEDVQQAVTQGENLQRVNFDAGGHWFQDWRGFRFVPNGIGCNDPGLKLHPLGQFGHNCFMF